MRPWESVSPSQYLSLTTLSENDDWPQGTTPRAIASKMIGIIFVSCKAQLKLATFPAAPTTTQTQLGHTSEAPSGWAKCSHASHNLPVSFLFSGIYHTHISIQLQSFLVLTLQEIRVNLTAVLPFCPYPHSSSWGISTVAKSERWSQPMVPLFKADLRLLFSWRESILILQPQPWSSGNVTNQMPNSTKGKCSNMEL